MEFLYMLLKSEIFARECISEAVYAIEELNRISRQATQIHERFESGLLSESNARLLNEDLNKAMGQLQSSAQKGMSKIDKAIDFLENFTGVCDTATSDPADFWATLRPGFAGAKEIVADLANLELGTMDSVKSLFSNGGKYAAIMDNLAAEMSINAVFVKMVSGGMAQLIRSIKTLPSEYAQDPANKKDGVTLEEYVAASGSKQTIDDMIGAFVTAAEEVQTNNGGYAFSIKGIKNFFSKNAGSIGLAALGGGIATIATGGAALPGVLAALAIGGVSGGAKALKREPDDAMGAYKINLDKLADSLRITPLSALEGGIPLFVKAVKGVNQKEFADAAEEAKNAIQSISQGVDVEDLINTYLQEFGDQAPDLKTLYTLDPKRVISLFSDFIQSPDDFKDLTIYDDFIDLRKQSGLSESFAATKDKPILLESNQLHHKHSLSSLLFEESIDEKRKRKKSKKKSKKKPAKAAKKTTSNPKKSSDKPKSGQQKQSADDKKKYKSGKSKIKSYGQRQLKKAEAKPSSQTSKRDAVQKKEDSINRGLKDRNQKTNITKIADKFEKQIMALDKNATPENPASDDKKNKTSRSDNADSGSNKGSGDSEGDGFLDGLIGRGKDAVNDKIDATLQDVPGGERIGGFLKDKANNEIESVVGKTKSELEDAAEKHLGMPKVELPTSLADTERKTSTSKAGPADQSLMKSLVNKLPSFKDIKGMKRVKDKDAKFLSILTGAQPQNENAYVNDLFQESYDRRLLKLSGL
jgi:hypothetical protein